MENGKWKTVRFSPSNFTNTRHIFDGRWVQLAEFGRAGLHGIADGRAGVLFVSFREQYAFFRGELGTP